MNLIPWSQKVTGVSLPSVRTSEDNKSYAIKARFPGMEKKDIKVSLHNNILTISGEKKKAVEEKKKNSYYKETRYASFSRSLSLQNSVNKAKMKSEFKDGVFTVTLPKK